mmetsp:Transcript_3905/g.5950  ORF Transcript_3905/g.5950 Transcript_3905/m.5950 type:complete len:90 (+) Transcript_3905:1149-1418(+)
MDAEGPQVPPESQTTSNADAPQSSASNLCFNSTVFYNTSAGDQAPNNTSADDQAPKPSRKQTKAKQGPVSRIRQNIKYSCLCYGSQFVC